MLEGLLAYEQATGGSDAVGAARRGGEAYLLERSLRHRLSTGDIPVETWTRLSYPIRWRLTPSRADRPG